MITDLIRLELWAVLATVGVTVLYKIQCCTKC
jgi:hypothetical protein